MSEDTHVPAHHSARFRFYEELNDFLPLPLRKTSFYHQFFNRPAIKDTIEALGVPHSEIDVILVNGDSVGFGYRLTDGDTVAVYPVFESFDITPLQRPHPAPLRQIAFIADGTAGRLVRTLRLLGLDTEGGSVKSESAIIRSSLRESRIIMSGCVNGCGRLDLFDRS